jgi:hypothetical protein
MLSFSFSLERKRRIAGVVLVEWCQRNAGGGTWREGRGAFKNPQVCEKKSTGNELRPDALRNGA